MRKIIALGIILLFLGMTISSSTGLYLEKQSIKSMSSGNTLYVGGNGTGNYSKIQDAINDSSNGDTVFVYDDSSPYYEYLIINNSVNLIGEDKNTTVIDNDGVWKYNVVDIYADYVNISGFTIRNSGQLFRAGIRIRSDHNTITDNNILDNYDGIDLYYFYHNNNIITNNNISNNKAHGMELCSSKFNIIKGNTISKNGHGICLIDDSNGNIIDGNTITSNNKYSIFLCGELFISSGPRCNTIINNTISNSQYGMDITWSNFNTIKGNTITSNNDYGIAIDRSFCNIINGNTISNSKYGILSFSSKFNIIKGNTISKNDEGIILSGSSSVVIGEILLGGSIFNIIIKNNFIDNKRNAFFLNSRLNLWKQNYWNESRILPKLIFGEICISDLRIAWIPKIDWHPAKEPYDIGV